MTEETAYTAITLASFAVTFGSLAVAAAQIFGPWKPKPPQHPDEIRPAQPITEIQEPAKPPKPPKILKPRHPKPKIMRADREVMTIGDLTRRK